MDLIVFDTIGEGTPQTPPVASLRCFDEPEDLFCFDMIGEGDSRAGPVDGDAVALHAAEPGHLAFGKLMDGISQGNHHVVVA